MDDDPLLLTFEDARQIVSAEPYDGPGTFYVAPYGALDDAFVWVIAGPREWIVDDDPAYLIPDDLVRLVDRLSGDVVYTGYMEVREILDDMARVGPWPDDQQ